MARKKISSLLWILLVLQVSCASEKHVNTSYDTSFTYEIASRYGDHRFPIKTSVPEAQEAFNKAIILTYSFSHAAAEKEFRRAAELDKLSPMPWWGVALVNGPHINFPLVPEEKAKIAWQALKKAKELKINGTSLEQDLIDALSKRYVAKQGQDRSMLDAGYASAMKEVVGRHPSNADVITLYAESLMDLHPWDYWEVGGNIAKPWTPEIVTTIESALRVNENHPGANHLYIHLMEASSTPEKAIPSAERLRTLVPVSGHLQHMPAHIFIRVGRWVDAGIANENAIAVDEVFKKSNPRPGFYAVYMLHNHHFLSFVRMMQGQQASALKSARAMLSSVPEDFMKEYGPIADGYFAIVFEVLMRFGNWNALLSEPAPPKDLPLANALWRFTRATAYSALGENKQADSERSLFIAAINQVPKDATFGNNSAHAILSIARDVLDGEMAARKGEYDAAIKLLQSAKKREDSLTYDEPPDWIIPTRHALGLTMLKAGKPAEAEVEYKEDLKKFPDNIWSLTGLYKALEMQKKIDESEVVAKQLSVLSETVDSEISDSCLCQLEAPPKN